MVAHTSFESMFSIDQEKRKYFKDISEIIKTNTISDHIIFHSDYVQHKKGVLFIKGFYYDSPDKKIKTEVEAPELLNDDIFEGMCYVEAFLNIENVLPF